MDNKRLFLFVDEGGNFDFSPTGTRYFTLSCLCIEIPELFYSGLSKLKYEFLSNDVNLECFHASEDMQNTRDKVFQAIMEMNYAISIHSVIIEKKKTNPSIRDTSKFYPKMLKILLNYVINSALWEGKERIVIITDKLENKARRKAVESAIKQTLKRELVTGIKYQIWHHASKSNFNLQIIDYCNWAIYRKWNNGDVRSFNIIQSIVKSEFDVFAGVSDLFY